MNYKENLRGDNQVNFEIKIRIVGLSDLAIEMMDLINPKFIKTFIIEKLKSI